MPPSSTWARGSVDVFYNSQIVENGDPKFEGGVTEPLVSYQLTTMFRPQEIHVDGNSFRRECMTILHLGTRSGAEASSPTRNYGCLGIAELRRLITKHLWKRTSTENMPTFVKILHRPFCI